MTWWIKAFGWAIYGTWSTLAAYGIGYGCTAWAKIKEIWAVIKHGN